MKKALTILTIAALSFILCADAAWSQEGREIKGKTLKEKFGVGGVGEKMLIPTKFDVPKAVKVTYPHEILAYFLDHFTEKEGFKIQQPPNESDLKEYGDLLARSNIILWAVEKAVRKEELKFEKGNEFLIKLQDAAKGKKELTEEDISVVDQIIPPSEYNINDTFELAYFLANEDLTKHYITGLPIEDIEKMTNPMMPSAYASASMTGTSVSFNPQTLLLSIVACANMRGKTLSLAVPTGGDSDPKPEGDVVATLTGPGVQVGLTGEPLPPGKYGFEPPDLIGDQQYCGPPSYIDPAAVGDYAASEPGESDETLDEETHFYHDEDGNWVKEEFKHKRHETSDAYVSNEYYSWTKTTYGSGNEATVESGKLDIQTADDWIQKATEKAAGSLAKATAKKDVLGYAVTNFPILVNNALKNKDNKYDPFESSSSPCVTAMVDCVTGGGQEGMHNKGGMCDMGEKGLVAYVDPAAYMNCGGPPLPDPKSEKFFGLWDPKHHEDTQIEEKQEKGFFERFMRFIRGEGTH